MTLAACGREIPVTPELLTWLAADLGARGAWLVRIAFGADRVRPAELNAAIPGLRDARRIRREQLQTEFVRTNRMPKDAAVAGRILAIAMPKRLARDALYQALEQVLALFSDAHRTGEFIVCASYEECAPAAPAATDSPDEE